MTMSVGRGRVLVVCSAAGFGLMPVLARYAYAAGLNVPTLLLWRFGLAAALLFGYLALAGRLRLPAGREWGRLLLLGGVLYALQAMLYFSAVRFVSPALAALLLYLYPALVLLLHAALSRTRPAPRQLAAVGVSLAGLAVVLGYPGGGVRLAGVLLALAAGGVYAAYIVLGDRTAGTMPPLLTAGWVAAFAAAAFGVTGAATGSLHGGITAAGWGAIAGVAVFSTVVAIGCFFAGMAVIGPTGAAILSMVEPVVSVVAAAVLLSEAVTGWQAAGGALVLAGAAWGVLADRPPRRDTPPT
ncbi:permease [Pilimelia anulata]|uniref:Permease n=1 Tax=Pilimelia anulata TaxID=53371 RepID=A0A8J3B498_9ACTN|nr:DMT family transporter [Pilimelia anulata]GGJ87729.1 permease [Pilimelia anulata]